MTDETNKPEWKLSRPESPTPGEGVGASEQKEQEPSKENTTESADLKTKEIAPGIKPSPRRPTRTTTPIPQVRDEIAVRIEKILEDGVGDAFSRLSPVAKQEFKLKGEQTAIAIRDLLKASHIQIKKIFRLIFEWLKVLPGINHFFLEQEAKIKADRIIAIHDQLKKQ